MGAVVIVLASSTYWLTAQKAAQVAMPDIQRMQVLEALDVLESRGFENITIKGQDTQDPDEVGVVLEQIPAPRQEVSTTAEISIITGDPVITEGATTCSRRRKE